MATAVGSLHEGITPVPIEAHPEILNTIPPERQPGLLLGFTQQRFTDPAQSLLDTTAMSPLERLSGNYTADDTSLALKLYSIQEAPTHGILIRTKEANTELRPNGFAVIVIKTLAQKLKIDPKKATAQDLNKLRKFYEAFWPLTNHQQLVATADYLFPERLPSEILSTVRFDVLAKALVEDLFASTSDVLLKRAAEAPSIAELKLAYYPRRLDRMGHELEVAWQTIAALRAKDDQHAAEMAQIDAQHKQALKLKDEAIETVRREIAEQFQPSMRRLAELEELVKRLNAMQTAVTGTIITDEKIFSAQSPQSVDKGSPATTKKIPPRM